MYKGKKKNQIHKSKLFGLTLIEVLAAIVIIGAVLSISIPKFGSQVQKVNVQAEEVNQQLLQGAVRQFKLDTGIYPADLNYLLRNPGTGIPGWAGPYLKNLPISPTGRAYDLEQATGRVIVR